MDNQPSLTAAQLLRVDVQQALEVGDRQTESHCDAEVKCARQSR